MFIVAIVICPSKSIFLSLCVKIKTRKKTIYESTITQSIETISFSTLNIRDKSIKRTFALSNLLLKQEKMVRESRRRGWGIVSDMLRHFCSSKIFFFWNNLLTYMRCSKTMISLQSTSLMVCSFWDLKRWDCIWDIRSCTETWL